VNWFLPTLGYVVLLGLFGVTAKLALRTITWEQLLFWLPFAYLVWIITFVVTRGTKIPLGTGGAWAIATALLGATAVVLLFIGLQEGDASSVIPVSSAYPVVTLLASAVLLSETLTLSRIVGTALVVAGLVLLGR
jgi:transporter family protein